jgi:predicted PurR-regulated permease PerM
MPQQPEPCGPGPLENPALLLLLVGISLAFGLILLPFYGAIMWGSIIALLFAPWYRCLSRWFKGRRTAAALLTLLVALLIVVLPLGLLVLSVAREASQVYELIQSGAWKPIGYFHELYAALPEWIVVWLNRFGLVDLNALQHRLDKVLTQGSQLIAANAYSIGQNTLHFAASLFITLYLAFFLIRDGEEMMLLVRQAIPLPPRHQQELIGKFNAVIRSTVKGSLLVAAIQGVLGGLAFWWLDVSEALLWGVLMAFLSLLPAFGSALVWLPVALYFLVTGALWQGIVLMAFGTLVIGLIDNLLRPMLVGRDTRLPDYVVMIATLGGIAVFGINGLVLGPAIAAMFIAVWHIYRVSRSSLSA